MLFWLDESRVVNICYAATEPSIGLKLRAMFRYKLYFSDTGLLFLTRLMKLRYKVMNSIENSYWAS